MSTPERSIIAPFLNPEYWDGRMIGQDNPDKVTRSYVYGQAKFADQTVANYLEHHRTPYPLVTYKDGEEIDANDHQVGTLLYGNVEILSAKVPLVLNDELTDTEYVAKHPTDTGFELTEYTGALDLESIKRGLERAHEIRVDDILYRAVRCFIVVTQGKRRQHNLQPVREDHLFRFTDGSIRNMSASGPLDSPFVVGQTSHTKIGKWEHLLRVNALVQTSQGNSKRSPSFADRLAEMGLNPFSQHS